jgi:hypothetical protein
MKSCYMELRDIILSQSKHITPELKYGYPVFYYKGKMFCYLWFYKKYQQSLNDSHGKLFPIEKSIGHISWLIQHGIFLHRFIFIYDGAGWSHYQF